MNNTMTTYLKIIALGTFNVLCFIINSLLSFQSIYGKNRFITAIIAFFAIAINVMYFALFYKFFYPEILKGGN